MTSPGPIRELTWEERARWGVCPVCKAEPGVRCSGLGTYRTYGNPPTEAAHYTRIDQAPLRVREVEA